MAAPVITCPACTKKFKGKDEFQGKKIKCPLCQTPFVVTAAHFKAATPEKKPDQAKSTQRVTWNAEDDDKDPYKLGEFDVRARCPNCANLMESEDAIICLHCGYNTMTREWGQTVRTVGVTTGQHILHLLPGIAALLTLLLFLWGLLFFALELPRYVVNTWAAFTDHESIRMWFSGIVLAMMWMLGTIAYRRLIVNPKPEERVKGIEEQDD
ncbi:MAG: zinc-ribbon domain-containing protein [Gemmataceae bacterium]|nr:zinc-ribbon domain-containing protein [Gemmataceae bacterium]